MELLEVGSEAETCKMAGVGMNYLRGTIVCYNAKNNRYTLELGNGDMMSLKARNVKAIVNDDDDAKREKEAGTDSDANSNEDDDEVSRDSNSKASIVMVETVEEDRENNEEAQTKEEIPSLLPKANTTILKAKGTKKAKTKKTESTTDVPIKQEEPVTTSTPTQTFIRDERNVWNNESNVKKRELNIIDRLFFAIFELFADLTPSVMLVGVLAALVVNKMMFGGNSSDDDGSSGKSNKSSYDYDGYDYYYHRPYHWHYWSWWPFGFFSVGGLFSVLIVSFFIYQWGTAKGQCTFRWDRVKNRAMNMDFWEAMRMFALLEGAFYFIAHVARGGNAVPRRRRY